MSDIDTANMRAMADLRAALDELTDGTRNLDAADALLAAVECIEGIADRFLRATAPAALVAARDAADLLHTAIQSGDAEAYAAGMVALTRAAMVCPTPPRAWAGRPARRQR